jgi:hypothetical protein
MHTGTVPSFTYHPDIAARLPTIAGGVVHAVGLTNGPSSSDLADLEALLQTYGQPSALASGAVSAATSSFGGL